MRLVYYCPFSIGGIFDYAYTQAAALAEAGVEVHLLTAGTEIPSRGNLSCIKALADECRSIDMSNRVARQVRRSSWICSNIRRLRGYVTNERIPHVLMASYSEYAAPLWSPYLRRLARSGVHFGAVLHDPYRNYVAGPAWWHRQSIQSGYSFLRDAFAHEAVDLAEIGMPAHVRLTIVPHGPSDFPPPIESREEVRRRLGIPEHAKLLLSFGQIRDGKNLDLVIRAMRQFDDFWLLVAGEEAGGIQQPLSYYRGLAEECGVAGRCRWLSSYLPADQVGGFFLAADLVLITYSRAFRSSSGVLNAAVQFARPCLVSSGHGPLRTHVQRYRLGAWVEPDDVETIQQGFRQWLGGMPDALRSDYMEDNSWHRNAQLVRDRLFSDS